MYASGPIGQNLGKLNETRSTSLNKLGVTVGPIGETKIAEILKINGSKDILKSMQFICQNASDGTVDLTNLSSETSEIELLNKLKGHINNTLDKNNETLDEATLTAVQNLYVLLKAARKKGLSSDALNRYELTKRVDFTSGKYGSQTREKDGQKSDTNFNKTAWTSYLKSLIKYHEKQVKKTGGKIPDVTPKNQQHYLLKMAVKLRLTIDLNEAQITDAFNKTYTGDRKDDIHKIVDEIQSATTISPPQAPESTIYGVGGSGLSGVPRPPKRNTGSPIASSPTSGSIDAPVSSRLSIPNSEPVHSKGKQFRDLWNQLHNLKDRFSADNSMMDGGEVEKYFNQLERVLEHLDPTNVEPASGHGSSVDDSEKLIQKIAEVAEKAFKVNGFYPRANQLLSVLMFAQGKDSNALGQIRTGQGKTLIAAMTAIVRQQVYGQDVVIISTTEPLAEDGAKDQMALYDACEVPVSYFSDQEKKVGDNSLKSPRVIYATSFSLESDKLRQEKVNGYTGTDRDSIEPKLNIWRTDSQSKPTVCFVVDECDSVLYDHAGSVIRSSAPLPCADEIQAIATDIAKEVKKDPTKDKQVIKDSVAQKINGNKTLQLYVESHLDGWIDDALAVFNKGSNFRDGVNYVKSSSIGSFIDASYAPLTRSVGDALKDENKTRFEQIATQLSASLIKQENGEPLLTVQANFKRYIDFIHQQVEGNAVVPGESLQGLWQKVHGLYKAIDQKFKESGSTNFTLKDMYPKDVYYVDEATGQVIPNMRFEGLKHLFMEYKEYNSISLKPTTALDYQSQLGLLLDGQCMVGFTGSLPDATFDPLNHLEFKSMLNVMYGADVPCAMVPDFKPRERIDLNPIQCIGEDEAKNKATWETEIKRNIESRTTTQNILLVCETIEDAKEFKASLAEGGRTIKMYTDKADADVAAEAHNANTVIITTRIGSRGTDWRVADECKASGLHVICTFPPGDARQRAQIQGRAGRSGSPGSTIEITYKPPPENKVKAKNSLVRAIMDELFSQMFYQLEQSVKAANRDDLTLWFSIDKVRNTLATEVREAIESGKTKDEVIEIIKQKVLPSEGNTGVIFKDWFTDSQNAISAATKKIETCLSKYFDVLTRLLVTPKATEVDGLAALDEMNTLSELTREHQVLQQIDEFIQHVNSDEFTEPLTKQNVTGVFGLIQEVESGFTLMKQITARLKPKRQKEFDKLIDEKLDALLQKVFVKEQGLFSEQLYEEEDFVNAQSPLINDKAFLRAINPKDAQQKMRIIAKAAELQDYDLLYRYLDDDAVTSELLNPISTERSYLQEIVSNAIRSMPESQFGKLLSHEKIKSAFNKSFKEDSAVAFSFVFAATDLGIPQLIQGLVDAGAKINATDNAGNTTLHWAAASGNASLIQGLVDAGADIKATDNDENTPLVKFREFLEQSSSGGQIDGAEQIIQLLTPKATAEGPSENRVKAGIEELNQSSSQLPTISVEGSVLQGVFKEFESEVAQQATRVYDLSFSINMSTPSGQQSLGGQSQSTVEKKINCSLMISTGTNGLPCIVGVSNMADFAMLIENYERNKDMIDRVLISIGFNDPGGFMTDVQAKYKEFKNDQPLIKECAEITLGKIADINGREFKTNSFPDNLYVRQIQDGEVTRNVMNTVGDGNCGFNAIALGLLDNLTHEQLQVCIDQRLLVFDAELIKNSPFDDFPNPMPDKWLEDPSGKAWLATSGQWLKDQFQSIKTDFDNPQIVDKASIIKKQRWLQQVLAGSLRASAVTAVDALWDQVMPQIQARVEYAVNQISALTQRSQAGEDISEDLKYLSDTCKYFGKGMGQLITFIGSEGNVQTVKVEEWLNGEGKKYYLETLDTTGFNADNLPMEALVHHIQNQLSRSKMGDPRLVSHISSSQGDIQSGGGTAMVNRSDIEEIKYKEDKKDLLIAALYLPEIGVADGFTDFDKPFTLIYKSDEDLNSDAQWQPVINQYKRLRDAVFKGNMKPITAVNSGGHWSYVEPANPQGEE